MVLMIPSRVIDVSIKPGAIHRRRRQSGLGRLTPVEYELIMTTAATQAA